MTEPFRWSHLIAPAAALGAALVVGLFADRLVRARLAGNATLTRLGVNRIVVAALRWVVLVWFLLAGGSAAVRALPLRPAYAAPAQRALVALAILSGTLVAARITGDVVRIRVTRASAAVPVIFINLARLAVVSVGLLILLQTLGVAITPLLTALGIGGLAVALAMQDTLSNLFAGIQLLASRKIRTGDYIRLDSGEEGFVTDINWRNASIRQLPDNLVIVPNARLAEAVVTNFNRPQEELAVLVDLNVAYETDLARAEEVTLDVARETLREVPGGVAAFEPLVRYSAFAADGVAFTVVLRAHTFTDRFMLVHEFVKRISERFRREGIVIPFPTRSIRFEGDRAAAGSDEVSVRRAP